MQIVKSARSFLAKALNAITLREQSPENAGFYSLLGRDYKFGDNTKDFLVSAYGGNPYVFMIVDRIAKRLVEIDKTLLNSRGEEIEDVDFSAFLKKPNRRESGDAILYRAAAGFLACGECFIVREQALGEEDQYFVPVNFNVTINEDLKGNVISYQVKDFGTSSTYLPNEVLHISKPDITKDNNHGFSTLRATRKVWESNNEVWASEASLHRNKGITGVLYSDGSRPMTDTEQKDLQSKYDGDNTGATNFGKVKVSSSKLGYLQMGMNPNDLKSIETRLEHLRTLCASFGVDSKVFGDPAASSYNNMAEAQRAFIINAVIPLSKELLPAIIGFMSASFFKVYALELDEDSIHELQITKEQKSARVGREIVQGILTQRQAQEILYPELVAEDEDGQRNRKKTNGPTSKESFRCNKAFKPGQRRAKADLSY
jgi:HK97 family phage portal protein